MSFTMQVASLVQIRPARPPAPPASDDGGIAAPAAAHARLAKLFLEAGKEQGLVPDGWDSGRAAPFVANFVVVAGVAPASRTIRSSPFAVSRF